MYSYYGSNFRSDWSYAISKTQGKNGLFNTRLQSKETKDEIHKQLTTVKNEKNSINYQYYDIVATLFSVLIGGIKKQKQKHTKRKPRGTIGEKKNQRLSPL